jgi:lipid-binding SYLF domain-containing protein
MDRTWGALAMYALDMTSLRLQVGSAETDFVLVIIITTQKGVKQVLNGKTKLGSNASATACPTGAHAASYSVEKNIDILTYARLRGPVGGVSLAGASMENDEGADKAIYGKDEGANDIVQGSQAVVPAAKPVVDCSTKRPRCASSFQAVRTKLIGQEDDGHILGYAMGSCANQQLRLGT